jgi:DNA polymerase-1
MDNIPKNKPLLIIDGYGFVFRAYHVQPPLTSPEGQPVGAIYGFTSMLLKLINDFKPEYAVVVLDSKGKNFRHDLFKEYKANRPPAPDDLISQLQIVQKAAEALNFCVLAKDGFEADDIIATIAKNTTFQGQEAIIISSDKDLLQLMDDKIRIYDPVKSKFISADDVLAKFGVLPNKLREVQALMGDASDNIPGVKGIGPKTASELINNFGDLEGVYASLDKIKSLRQQELLINYKTQAFLSWQLVGLDTQVDVPKNLDVFAWLNNEELKIVEFITKYGFRSLGKRIENLFNIKIEQHVEQIIKPSLKLEYSQSERIIINSNDSLSELQDKIEDTGVIGVSFEQRDNYNIVSIALKNQIYLLNYNPQKLAYVVDLFSYANKDSLPIYYNEFIDKLFASFSVKKITSDLKNLYKNFIGPLNSFEDLNLMDYCLSAGNKTKSIEEIINYYTANNVDSTLSTIDLSQYFSDCYEAMKTELFNQKTLHLYQTIDLPLCRILHCMEVDGIKINIPYLQKLSTEFQKEIELLEKEIFKFCGEEFNVSSPKQLGQILFEKLKLPFSKISGKSKSYGTGVEILEKLSEDGYGIADLLLKYRHLTKLKNTYTDTLPKQADPRTSRIHTTFLQTSTTTGRLSSNNPNVQNIPIRTKEGNNIRAAFVASSGYKLISADYSQIELRILSHVANIKTLKEAFIKGEDIHKQTASQIFGVKLDEVTPELRRNAKAINFGIIYGISSFGLAKNLNITRKSATDYIAKYFQEYPGIEKYMADTINFAKQNLYVENLLGRRCYIPMINNKNHALRSFAERAAINAPMQSLTADIAKMAMVAIDKKLQADSFKTKMILQIHDELVFEAPLSEVETVAKLVKSTMENIITLDVPTVVDVSCGDNWQEI